MNSGVFWRTPVEQLSRKDIESLLNIECESLLLEMKQQPWPSDEKGNIKCVCDIVAFANAEGGRIVVGCVEKNEIVAGFMPIPNADSSVMCQRIENLLATSVDPPLRGVRTYIVPWEENTSIVVVSIPRFIHQCFGVVVSRTANSPRYEFWVRTSRGRKAVSLQEYFHTVRRRMEHDTIERLQVETELKSFEESYFLEPMLLLYSYPLGHIQDDLGLDKQGLERSLASSPESDFWYDGTPIDTFVDRWVITRPSRHLVITRGLLIIGYIQFSAFTPHSAIVKREESFDARWLKPLPKYLLTLASNLDEAAGLDTSRCFGFQILNCNGMALLRDERRAGMIPGHDPWKIRRKRELWQATFDAGWSKDTSIPNQMVTRFANAFGQEKWAWG